MRELKDGDKVWRIESCITEHDGPITPKCSYALVEIGRAGPNNGERSGERTLRFRRVYSDGSSEASFGNWEPYAKEFEEGLETSATCAISPVHAWRAYAEELRAMLAEAEAHAAKATEDDPNA